MIEQELLRYGYLLLLLGSIFEGDATVLSAAFLANRGYFPLYIVILIAAGATTAANQLYYLIARRKVRHSVERRIADQQRYHRVYAWIQRRAGLLLVFSRFIYGLRIAIPAACGAIGMGPRRFLALNLVGAFVWAVPVGLVGYFFGHTFGYLFTDVRNYDWMIAAAILVGVAAFLLARHMNDLPGAVTIMTHPEDLGEESTERLEDIYRKVREFEEHHHGVGKKLV